ncbi:peptidylprolyl isomerase, partial [bacterium]|nr:peptidylprolyl isomerase [bacterium]
VDRVIAPVFVTADEAWEEYQATARKYNAAIVSFLPRNYEVDTTSVTESEIRAYYTEHRADYRQPERRQLAYISIPIVATIEDSNRVVELARELVIRSQSGEDFAELAGEFSEDGGSAQQGGDLGYFTSGRMVKEFDSTCFATEPGRTVGPIITRFGAHVIKVVDRKPGAEGDSVRASHILIKWDVGPDTEERISQKAKDFTDAAKTDGWERAAATLGLEVQETDPFPKNPSGSIPGLGPLQPLMDFTFASKTGNVSYVYRTRVRGQEAYAVFQLKKIIPEAISPVADVESQIRRTLLQDKRLELARQAAQAFRARVSDANSFLAVAQTESLKVDTSGEHAPRDYNRSWGSDEEIVKSLFALEPGQISQPLGNARGVYVALLINKTESNQQQFAAQKEEILTRLRQRKQNNLYTDWLAQAKVDIGVVDKRHLYYTDY